MGEGTGSPGQLHDKLGPLLTAQTDYGYEYEQGEDQHHHEEELYDDDRQRQGGKGPSQPYRDVIFLGLDDELTEDDVSSLVPIPSPELIGSSLHS